MAPRRPPENHVGIDDADVDQALADGLGNRGADDKGRHEIEEGRPEDRLFRGLDTRVDTTVAIELALSWKPLMKSKTSATATIRTTYSTPWSMLRRA